MFAETHFYVDGDKEVYRIADDLPNLATQTQGPSVSGEKEWAAAWMLVGWIVRKMRRKRGNWIKHPSILSSQSV